MAEQTKRAAIVARPVARAACVLCGKQLTSFEGTVRGMGPICFDRVVSRLPAGSDRTAIEALPADEFAALVAVIKAETSFKANGFEGDPEAAGYVRLRELREAVLAAGKSIASMVSAMGGDRKVNPPKAPYWEPIYAKRTRWVPAEALQHVGELNDARRARSKQTG